MKARAMFWLMLAAGFVVASAGWAQSDGQVTFGSQWWSQTYPEAKFQEFRVVPRGGLLESILMHENQGRYSERIWGTNLLQGDQHFGLMVARGVGLRLDGNFTAIPHLFSNVARSPYAYQGNGVYRLADSLQALNQRASAAGYIANMRDALGAAGPVPMAAGTNVSYLRLRGRPMPGWRFELRGTERLREGHMAYGATFGTSNDVELAIPISHRTRDESAIATYEHGRVRVQATAGLSQFHNNVSTLTWDNPKRVTDAAGTGGGAAAGRMDLAPDNRVARGLLSLGVRLPRASTFAATVGMSDARQDDAFLPYTSNTALAQSLIDSLPARKLDGKAVTTTTDLMLSGMPLDRVSGSLRWHSDNYDNQTPQYTFKGLASTDGTSFTADTIENDRRSWKRSALSADAMFRLTDWADVTVLGVHDRQTYDDREIPGTKENRVGGSLTLHPNDELSLTAGAQSGDRKIDEFDASHYLTSRGTLTDTVALRRYDLANRKQDQVSGSVTYSIGPRLDLGVDYTHSRNRYEETIYGLQFAEDNLVIVDANYEFSKTLDWRLGWGLNQVDSRQQGRESTTRTNWMALLRDRTIFGFSQGHWWARPKKVLVLMDYTYTRALGDYHFTNTPGTAGDLPSTLYHRHELQLESRWMLRPNFDVAARYGYDEFDVTDFATQGVPLLDITGTSATAIFLGDSMHGYTAHRLAVLASRRF